MVTLRNGPAVTFAVGFSLSIRQLDLRPQNILPVWERGMHAIMFWGRLGQGVGFGLISMFVLNILTTCCRYPVDIILMVTSFHCYIVSILAALQHMSLCSWRQIRGNMTFTIFLINCRLMNWEATLLRNSLLSDGGVWQSTRQKAPFPSGSVDQLAQETLCQARWSLAKRCLCQVSLKCFRRHIFFLVCFCLTYSSKHILSR